MSSGEFHLRLPIRPEWPHVELLRVTLQNCLRALPHHGYSEDAVSLTVSELLENAIKYGQWDGAPDRAVDIPRRRGIARAGGGGRLRWGGGESEA